MISSLNESNTDLSSSIIIDFGGHFKSLEHKAKAYRDLSLTQNFEEAAHNLYETLRWTETVEGAQKVLIFDFENIKGINDHNQDGIKSAIIDRVFRATSGQRL